MPTLPSGRPPPGPTSSGPSTRTSRVHTCKPPAKRYNVGSHKKQQYPTSKARKNSTPATNNREKLQHCRNSKRRNSKTKKHQKKTEEELAYIDSSWWSSEDTPRQQKRSNGTRHSRVAIRNEHKEVNQPVKKIWLALQLTQEWEAQ